MKILKTITASIALVAVLWIGNVNANTITAETYFNNGDDANILCNGITASQCQGFDGGPLSDSAITVPAVLSDVLASYHPKEAGDAAEIALMNELLTDIGESHISTITAKLDVPDGTSSPDTFTVDSLYFSIKQSQGLWFFKNISGGSLIVDMTDIDFSHVTQYGGVVPIPAAVWLFGSALLGLVGFKHKRAQTMA